MGENDVKEGADGGQNNHIIHTDADHPRVIEVLENHVPGFVGQEDTIQEKDAFVHVNYGQPDHEIFC